MRDFQVEMCVWILQNIEWEFEKLHEICYGHDKDMVNDLHGWTSKLREIYENEM